MVGSIRAAQAGPRYRAGQDQVFRKGVPGLDQEVDEEGHSSGDGVFQGWARHG